MVILSMRSRGLPGDFEDDLATVVTLQSALECFARIFERKSSFDDWTELAGLDQARDFRQLRAIRFNDEEDAADAVFGRFLRGDWRDDADENTAGTEDAPGAVERVTADSVEGDIDLANLVFEAQNGVIDDFVGSEAAYEAFILLSGSCDHVGTSAVG
jgi:hypothetical protein